MKNKFISILRFFKKKGINFGSNDFQKVLEKFKEYNSIDLEQKTRKKSCVLPQNNNIFDLEDNGKFIVLNFFFFEKIKKDFPSAPTKMNSEDSESYFPLLGNSFKKSQDFGSPLNRLLNDSVNKNRFFSPPFAIEKTSEQLSSLSLSDHMLLEANEILSDISFDNQIPERPEEQERNDLFGVDDGFYH